MMHPAVDSISTTSDEWLGSLDTIDLGVWIDFYLLLIFGGIPWQVKYLQKVFPDDVTSCCILQSHPLVLLLFIVLRLCVEILQLAIFLASVTQTYFLTTAFIFYQ